ncbi:MAG: response regulator [Elusimicrobia bacterium]|nr:response regulator [Elusimicrobiota bacterium]
MNNFIAIVEDEEDIAELIAVNLSKSGYKTKVFHEAKPFLLSIRKNLPDLIILDLMLPDADGLELCKNLKREDQFSKIPIIMLTAKAEETDKILGLEIGADDYITKPFSPRELVARVKAVLRRGQQKSEERKKKSKDLIEIDKEKHSVLIARKPVNLTVTEFKILELLLSKRGYVFPREKILDYVWGEEIVVVDRTVDVHIRHLRKKLMSAGKLIKSIHGVGYKLEE